MQKAYCLSVCLCVCIIQIKISDRVGCKRNSSNIPTGGNAFKDSHCKIYLFI